METPEQKEKLRKYVTSLYEECGQEVIPLFPKVLIRVLPRAQKKGNIWLPENKQNKPNWEAIVLRVYEPFYRKIYLTEASWVKEDPEPEVRYTQKVECQYQPGDHIVFPHIEFGQVPTPLDEGIGDYRVIPENIIVCRLDYTTLSQWSWLTDFIKKTTENHLEDFEPLSIAEEILKNADVLRKDVVPQTMSGE